MKSLTINEDWWSVFLGLAIVLAAVVAMESGNVFDAVKASVPAAWPAQPLLKGFSGEWPAMVAVLVVLGLGTGIGVFAMGGKVGAYLGGFSLFALGSIVVLIIGSQQTIKTYGLEYPFWALLIGLGIGNLLEIPSWFHEAAGRTELFIKTGIVLLGASFPFTTIVQGGGWGFLEALVIVAAGFTTATLVGRAFGFENRFIAVLGAGGSVCGVSAAIAVGSSVDADKKQIGYIVSLVVVFALALVFVLPLAAGLLGFDPVVAGAWIGGSELADAAGLASATLVGEKAVRAFLLVKLNRDVFIGFLSFGLATLALTRWKRKEGAGARPAAGMIWDRFPKFVLAFLLASALVTALTSSLGKQAVDAHLAGPLNTVRTWLFALAFLCIGINTKFKDLRSIGAKPVIAFSAVVLVNFLVGCLSAWLFFGGVFGRPLG